MSSDYIPNSTIERLAYQRLTEYQDKSGEVIKPPVPVEKIIEHVFDLRISWESIQEEFGEKIFGGLRPANKEIIINENHLKLFNEKPGLERFTKGHELGHWELHVDQSTLTHPLLPGFRQNKSFMHRRSSKGQVEVIEGLSEGISAYRSQKSSLKDSKRAAHLVNRYAAALLMPEDMVRKTASDFDLFRWPSLYRLVEIFNVTISAMCVRLQELKLIYVSDDGQIYSSKDEYHGQQRLL